MPMEVHEGGSYMHRKTGGVYRVICFAKIEADLTPAVVYGHQGSEDIDIWVRPLSEFIDGRFEPYTDEARAQFIREHT